MVAEPKTNAAKKKKRRRVPREEFVDYVAAIEDWGWSYSLLLNTEKHPVDPYHEFRHLVIIGRLLRPTGLKTDKVEVSLLPSVEMNHGQRGDHEPLALGSLACPSSFSLNLFRVQLWPLRLVTSPEPMRFAILATKRAMVPHSIFSHGPL